MLATLRLRCEVQVVNLPVQRTDNGAFPSIYIYTVFLGRMHSIVWSVDQIPKVARLHAAAGPHANNDTFSPSTCTCLGRKSDGATLATQSVHKHLAIPSAGSITFLFDNIVVHKFAITCRISGSSLSVGRIPIVLIRRSCPSLINL